jgi:hypothetical protein
MIHRPIVLTRIIVPSIATALTQSRSMTSRTPRPASDGERKSSLESRR